MTWDNNEYWTVQFQVEIIAMEESFNYNKCHRTSRCTDKYKKNKSQVKNISKVPSQLFTVDCRISKISQNISTVVCVFTVYYWLHISNVIFSSVEFSFWLHSLSGLRLLIASPWVSAMTCPNETTAIASPDSLFVVFITILFVVGFCCAFLLVHTTVFK